MAESTNAKPQSAMGGRGVTPSHAAIAAWSAAPVPSPLATRILVAWRHPTHPLKRKISRAARKQRLSGRKRHGWQCR